MRGLGWTVLALVFLDEVLAVVAAAVWGHHAAGLWLAGLAAVAVVTVWSLFASPRARYGGARTPVKVLVFCLATLGLLAAAHPAWAAAFLVFSVVVNGLALLPGVRILVAEESAAAQRSA